MKTLYITGFMGAGKTTIGKAMGELWQVPVLDTDQEVERKWGKTVREMFEQEGEGVFRSRETEMLQALPCQDAIITTGGGIVGKEENRQWMKRNGTVLYLYCDPELIAERLREDTTRPLLQQDNLDAFFSLFRARQPLYEEADIQIDTTGKSIAAIVAEIEEKIK
ncbi:shikimate kinase [Ectobacillus ponti]|uniref:Shikimate kinase n=1 Tax=Ectobacillus ponti TaxID=2961894 RepID=A0AA41X685_9BACI|nr:shikimate kinase [Ectobacillus ponti]MCP8967095.1 shikimate kinase [Ectobacillus ponti]